MRGVDTNVLVRFLTQDDRRQVDRVDSFFAALEEAGETAYVSTVVLCELAWVLRSLYGLRRKEIRATLEMLLQTAQLQPRTRPSKRAWRRSPESSSRREPRSTREPESLEPSNLGDEGLIGTFKPVPET